MKVLIAFYRYQIFALNYVVVKAQNMFSQIKANYQSKMYPYVSVTKNRRCCRKINNLQMYISNIVPPNFMHYITYMS